MKHFLVAAMLAAACLVVMLIEVRAEIPERKFVITDFGAVGDGTTTNTEAIRKAVAACSQAGGGTVSVPAGTFVTVPFELGSNMALELDAGATILGSENFDDYKQPGAAVGNALENELKPVMRPLISAAGATNIAIVGHGTIDGAGQRWWERVRKEKAAGAAAQGQKAVGMPTQSPRPRLVMFSDCGQVHVQGVTLKDAPNFNLVPVRCHDVVIEDVTIIAPSDSPNTDGIDPGNSRDVIIRRCTISVGDDHVSFKSNAGQPALENVRVSDCIFGHGHGTSVGSNIGGATAIAVTDGAAVVAFSCTVGTLDSNVLARVGATGFTNTNVGTPLTGGKGLRICATVANATTSTSVDYCVYYVVT